MTATPSNPVQSCQPSSKELVTTLRDMRTPLAIAAADRIEYLEATEAREVEPVAWMNREHVEAYTAGNPRGIAWASPEPTEFYDVALCVSLSPIPEAPTIDSTPSCGQENDYRRAQGSIPDAPVGREEIIAAAKAGYLKWLKSQHRVDSEALFNAIADEVCALKPQDGGNCEHGIAKVNCGICVPSEVFSGGSGR